MKRLRGLYLLVDEAVLPAARWAEILPAVLDAGPALVQYRAKGLAPATQRAHATELLAWCRRRKLPLLLNDDPALCAELGADGVHLGRDDAALAAARRRLGRGVLIGASCYDDLARAGQAAAAGADYLSFGRLFASTTKPEATPASLDTLRAARRLGPAICAIGGLNADNADQALAAGADLICCAAGILAQPDPVAAARKLATICHRFFEVSSE